MELDRITAALKALLKSLPSIAEVEISRDIITIHPSQPIILPLCLRLDWEILKAHEETINGEIATVIDDFRIVSAKLVSSEHGGEPTNKEDACPI